MNTDEENLITDNMNLAYDLAWKFYNKLQHRLEFEEIKALCLLGLTKAAKNFKSELNIKFSTFAYTCIRNEVYLFIRDNKKYINNISLSEKISGDDESPELQDIIPDSFDLVYEVENNSKLQDLYIQIDSLSDRHKTVIKYYLQGYTMSAIGEILGLSQPQISRDYQQALNILRRKLKDWR